jgi:mannose-6-phosphate isomerase-like protein (cupin superfamily)
MSDELQSYSVTVNNHLRTDLLVSPHESESNLAVLKHRLPPNKLGGPLHYHTHEDEISYILEGTMGLREGDSVTTYGAGDQVVKERETWHTYWNPGSVPLVFLELISPGHFANFFKDLAELQPNEGPPTEEELEQISELNEQYGLKAKPETIPSLVEEHGLDQP